jgi:hypothetical protein
MIGPTANYGIMGVKSEALEGIFRPIEQAQNSANRLCAYPNENGKVAGTPSN